MRQDDGVAGDDDEVIPEAPPGWLTEDEVIEQLQELIASQEIGQRLMIRLTATPAGEASVVGALLSLIFLISEQVNEPSRKFINFLLSAYPPVADLFVGDGTHLVSGIAFRRWFDNQGLNVLLVRSEDLADGE